MSYKLGDADQELQRGYMNMFCIIYVLKLKEVDQELQRGYVNICLIGYVIKAQGSRPWASKSLYECIPYWICLKGWRK